MKNIKYFFQFLIISICFIFFKILGVNLSSKIGGKIFEIIGPFFRSKDLIKSNIRKVFPEINKKNLKIMTASMWNNYGRVLLSTCSLKILDLEN